MLGLRYLLQYAEAVGAIDGEERQRLHTRGVAAFRALAEQQGEHQRAADPLARFPEMLATIISSGRGHIADIDGSIPLGHSESWGWTRRDPTSDAGQGYVPRGRKLGWTIDSLLYLDPDATFAALVELARDQGQNYPISKQTLQRRLNEAGLLIRHERDRTTYPVRVEGTRRSVLVLSPATIIGETGTTGIDPVITA
jgi:hypothetical protein